MLDVSVSMHDKFQQFLPFVWLWHYSPWTTTVACSWLGFLVSLFPSLSSGPRCSASWPVWTRRTVFRGLRPRSPSRFAVA